MSVPASVRILGDSRQTAAQPVNGLDELTEVNPTSLRNISALKGYGIVGCDIKKTEAYFMNKAGAKATVLFSDFEAVETYKGETYIEHLIEQAFLTLRDRYPSGSPPIEIPEHAKG